jgi:alpha-N-arabinofuranosidase
MFTVLPAVRTLTVSLVSLFLISCGGSDHTETSQTSSPGTLAASAGSTETAATESVTLAASTQFKVATAATVSVDLASAGTPVNRGLLGNNTQWVDNGDGLVTDSGQANAPIVAALKSIAPTVLRYPGGTLTDTYRWRDGVGPVSTRGYNRDLNNNMKKVVFGTNEFLQLSESMGSAPLFTVNVTTGTTQEAADWVAYVNGTGTAQKQRVPYWEIGNEPYLQETARPDLSMSPAEFARRASLAITAMKAVDPNIKVGLPLRSDAIGGVPATPYQGFNKSVLTGVAARIDFVSVHSAYLPFAYTAADVNDQDLFAAAMAATKVLAADLDATATQVKTLRPEGRLPIALTEYNALFGLSSARLFQYSTSLAGALYVADMLSMLGARDDIFMANIWSATGNGYFGAIDFWARPRPSFYVLQAYNQLLQGQRLLPAVSAPSFANPQVGLVPAGTATPVVSAFVTRQNKTMRIALVNKHPATAMSVTLKLANGRAATGGTFSRLSGPDLFAGAEGRAPVTWTKGTADGSGTSMTWSLPARSFTLYEIPLI